MEPFIEVTENMGKWECKQNMTSNVLQFIVKPSEQLSEKHTV